MTLYQIHDYITLSVLYRGDKPISRTPVIMSQDHPPYKRGAGVWDLPAAWPGPAWTNAVVGLKVTRLEGVK